MRRARRLALLAALVLAAAEGSASEPAAGAARALVTTSRSGVSITARDVPLEDLLRELSQATGLAVYFEQGLDPAVTRRPTTIAVRNATLEDVLRRLLRDTSFIVGYGAADRIDEVKIVAGGGGPFARLEALAKATGRPAGPDVRRRPTTDPPDPPSADLAGLETMALTHPDPVERAAALSRLGELLDDARAREVALSALDREQHPEVLREALNILEYQDDLPRERLMRFITSAHSPERRVQALDMLADSGTSDAAFRRLVTALTRDPSDEVRTRAAEILEDLELEDPE